MTVFALEVFGAYRLVGRMTERQTELNSPGDSSVSWEVRPRPKCRSLGGGLLLLPGLGRGTQLIRLTKGRYYRWKCVAGLPGIARHTKSGGRYGIRPAEYHSGSCI